MRQYPTVQLRGSAYSAAATGLGEPQVADGLHLALHQAVNETLQRTLGSDLLVRAGAGWIRVVNGAETSTSEAPSAGEGADRGDSLLVVS